MLLTASKNNFYKKSLQAGFLVHNGVIAARQRRQPTKDTIMHQATAKSTWKSGQKVSGVYMGKSFSGVLSDSTRPTPDYKNVQFVVTLDNPVIVFGTKRDSVTCITGTNDVVFLH